MGIAAASALVVLMCASAGPVHAGALQARRSVSRQAPEHHLREARLALDRAWSKATSAERERLGPLRAHFAELALAYAKIPTDSKSDAMESEASAKASPSTHPPTGGTMTPEPTGAGPGEPPRPSGAVPPPATSTKPPSEWQMKYAVVDEDLKSLKPEDNAPLRTRLDHFKTHLQMFYAAALGHR